MIYSQLKVGSRIFWKSQGCKSGSRGFGILLKIEERNYHVYVEASSSINSYSDFGFCRLPRVSTLIYKVEELLIDELLTSEVPFLQRYALKLLEKQNDDS